MVSDPKLQAAYHIFSPAPKWDTPAFAEWQAEVAQWARTAEREDYSLSDDDWTMFSTGVHPADRRRR